MIRGRGLNFTAAFDAVLAEGRIRTVLCNARTPRMNATAERWIGGCWRELLDRTLIWNQAHLRQILRLYQTLWVPITLSRPLTWCLLGEGSSS